MATLSFAFGTSHGPMLNTAPADWGQRARADRMNKALAFRDGTYSFEELLELRAPGFAHEVHPGHLGTAAQGLPVRDRHSGRSGPRRRARCPRGAQQ